MSTTPVLRFLFLVAAMAAWSVAGALSPEQQAWVSKGRRFQREGWTYLHIEGEAAQRGFQHGYLLAPEIADGLTSTRVSWEHSSAMTWGWLTERAGGLFADKIDPEFLAELDGIAEGVRTAGKSATREDLIAYNGIIELAGYWWPGELKKIKEGPAPAARESCSAFIATGKMTRDGNIVLGHNTMQGYQDTLPNVIMDLVPTKGQRILWQTVPGWIHSGTDFFITTAGLVGAETTIGGFEAFDTNGIPEFVRMRRATQDATSINQWCEIMRRSNNGGYANAWLLGDINTREIARLELGLREVAFETKKDGCFTGSNIAENNRLLRLETTANETDIRLSSVARRVRWKQLMRENVGHVDLDLARKFEADHYDAFLGKLHPGGRSLCGHFELDRDLAGNWPGVPYGCAGTVDAKVVDASMAGKMSFAARWGSACGKAFDAQAYLAAHPQFDWMEGLLKSRPAQRWAVFRAGE